MAARTNSRCAPRRIPFFRGTGPSESRFTQRVAADRPRGRWHSFATSPARFRRRQIGNFEVHRQHHPQRVLSSVSDFQARHGLSGCDSAVDFSTTSTGKMRPGAGTGGDPQHGALAGLGDQADEHRPEYTAAYNEWLPIPQTVRQLLITVKAYFLPNPNGATTAPLLQRRPHQRLPGND